MSKPYEVTFTALGTCRIGRAGEKAHPAMLETLRWNESGNVTHRIVTACSCASHRIGHGKNKWHSFVEGGTATCNGR